MNPGMGCDTIWAERDGEAPIPFHVDRVCLGECRCRCCWARDPGAGGVAKGGDDWCCNKSASGKARSRVQWSHSWATRGVWLAGRLRISLGLSMGQVLVASWDHWRIQGEGVLGANAHPAVSEIGGNLHISWNTKKSEQLLCREVCFKTLNDAQGSKIRRVFRRRRNFLEGMPSSRSVRNGLSGSASGWDGTTWVIWNCSGLIWRCSGFT